MRAAIYARVSTSDQTLDNQLLEVRRYAEARQWTVVEYCDSGRVRREGSTARTGQAAG